MATHFQLTRKSDLAAGPVDLNDLDGEICALYGETPDDKRYYYGWFDSIGWRLSCGKTWDEVREALQPKAHNLGDAEYCAVLSRLREIATWLEERFEVAHW